jgi:hypothetical protein
MFQAFRVHHDDVIRQLKIKDRFLSATTTLLPGLFEVIVKLTMENRWGVGGRSRSAPADVWMRSGGSEAAPGGIFPRMRVGSVPQNSRDGAAPLPFLSLSLPSPSLLSPSREDREGGGGGVPSRGWSS